MSRDPSEDLKTPELQPELQPAMQPLETESTFAASQQAATYYPPAGSSVSAPAGAAKSGRRLVILGVAAAAAVTAGVWYATTRPGPPEPVPAATSPAQTAESSLASSGAADVKATNYLKGVLGNQASGMARGLSTAAPGDASTGDGQLDAANAAALIALGQTAPEIAKEIRDGQRWLYRIRLGDEVEGDVFHAQLYVDGADVGDVNHGKGNILVPLIPGRPAHLKLVLTAARDSVYDVGLYLPSGEPWRSGILTVGGSAERQIVAQ